MKSKRKPLSRFNPFKFKNPLDLAITIFCSGLIVGIFILDYGNLREDSDWLMLFAGLVTTMWLCVGIYGIFRIHHLLKYQPKDQGFWENEVDKTQPSPKAES